MKESTFISLSSGNTLYVGGTGPNNYTTIQDAINDSSDGDTVFVYDDSSPYYERVQINTSINLIGEDKDTTVIDGKRKGHVIDISSDNVSIKEFTIQNSSSYDSGIRIYGGYGGYSHCTISDNNIIDNDDGINIDFSINDNTIEDNYFFNNKQWTIAVAYSNNNTITGNTIDHPSGTYPLDGILIHHGIGNNISDNKIYNCDTGIHLGSNSEYNTVTNNVISSGEYDGISIYESSNNKIIGNNISYNLYWGIEIDEDSRDNIIYHNNLLYNYENAIDDGNNIWDDGEYGNYWSDYRQKYPRAKKLRKEGIWDTPYEIPSEPPSESRGDNYDTRPLIKQWPGSVSKTIHNNENVWSNRLLERFPIFQNMLDVLVRFYDFYENMKGGIRK